MIAEIALPYPFELAFMQRALVAGIVVGAFAPMIGAFLVQKRMSLIGDGIGHVAFAGVGAGVILRVGHPCGPGARLRRRRRARHRVVPRQARTSGDVALALLFYSGIAVGVVLVSAGGPLANVLTYLFGQPLTVDAGEIAVIVGLGASIVIGVLALRRALFAVVTDEEWSRVAGLPVGVLNTVLAVSIAVSVVAAMRVVGILLIAAMMVLPVASAQLLARSFRGTMWWSVAIGVGSVVLGSRWRGSGGSCRAGRSCSSRRHASPSSPIARRGVALRLRTGGTEA